MEQRVDFLETKSRILDLVKRLGPLIPSKLGNVGTSLLFTSAILSELVSEKKLKVSNMKIGGSPLYFAYGQEALLQNFTEYLPEAEKRAVELLKRREVIYDEDVELVYRVAFRNLKDFAYQILEDAVGKKRIFWRWYLIQENDVEQKIKNIISEKEIHWKQQLQDSKVAKFVPAIQVAQQAQAQLQQPVQPTQQISVQPQAQVKRPSTDILQKDTKIKQVKLQVSRQKEEEKIEKVKEIKTKAIDKIIKTDKFLEKLHTYFLKNNIKVENEKIIKKNEIEFIVKVPSQLGEIKFYAIAKDKKTVSETDLILAYQKGQEKKLGTIYLSNGKINEKLKKKIDSLGVVFKSFG